MAHTKLSRKIRQRGNAMLEGALALAAPADAAVCDYRLQGHAILVKNTIAIRGARGSPLCRDRSNRERAGGG